MVSPTGTWKKRATAGKEEEIKKIGIGCDDAALEYKGYKVEDCSVRGLQCQHRVRVLKR
jgi:phosphoribosyl-AMP cyclohydrolase